MFTKYVKKRYKKNVIVVFDRYPENLAEKSTKSAECARQMITCTTAERAYNEGVKESLLSSSDDYS